MEELNILLEKYWRAETTLEEEAALRRAGVLGYFDEAPGLPPGFGERILGRLDRAGGMSRVRAGAARIGYYRGWIAAAATVALILGILWGAGDRTATTPRAAVPADTYRSPEQALAEVRMALMTVSVRMNEGRDITEKGMRKMNANWNTIIHD